MVRLPPGSYGATPEQVRTYYGVATTEQVVSRLVVA
jgi:hypothetical protein